MNGIKVLGAGGSRSRDGFTTCIQVTKHTVIDAGNVLHGLGNNALYINSIFFTHAHLDHIIDSAFIVDNYFVKRKEPLKLFGLPQTLSSIQKHLFNWEIWPDFSKLNFIGTKVPSIEYHDIALHKVYEIEEGITLEPINSVHAIPCCGYIIKKENQSLLFTSDTYLNDELWHMVNNREDINAIIIDVSFPNFLKKVAKESKHLTPELLALQMKLLTREVKIYVNHLKPCYEKELRVELFEIGISNDCILSDGVIIGYDGSILSVGEGIRKRVEKLNKIGIALSSEDNIDNLLEMIVSEAKSLTHADGGTLYIKDGEKLAFKVVQTDSLDIKMGGSAGDIMWDPLSLFLQDGASNKKMVAATCVLEDRIINIPDVYEAEGFSFDGTKAFDISTGYRSKSMLVVPLRDHEHNVIGVLQLINKNNVFSKEVEAFNKDDEYTTLSLASQAAVAINNVTLVNDLEKLLEAFLKSIIYAIEKKSSHTAGHIRRMVKLSVMTAEAIKNDKSYFRDKTFSKEEIKQINIAALMHDIGKLAIPEQIIDKTTKLESIFDRVELVLMRIELVKKDAKIALLQKEIDESVYQALEKELNEYAKIIRKSNVGAEFTPNEYIEIFNELSKKTYTFNKNTYTLLSINEAYNLSVQRGTLTEDERDIINKHAKISVEILNKLPFPKKYKEIPQISGNHHEKINGKGYPQGLKEDEISFEARILAITDIFEALTASDRPYKKANPLSLAMKILYLMAKDGDLDKGIVKFFYKSGLYLEYAKLYLPKSSIDEVVVDFDSL